LIFSYYGDNAIMQQENNISLSGYLLELFDILTFDEMNYQTPFNQQRIYKAIKVQESLKIQLQHMQKRTSLVRSGLIYTSMPRSIELLEKLQAEIDK